MRLPQVDLLHSLDVKIKRVCEGIGDFSSAEGFDEFADGVFDGEARRVAELAEDFFRGDVVGAVVVRGRVDDFDMRANDVADFVSDGVEREVLIAGIENLAVDLLGGQGEAFHIKLGAVAHMEIRAELGTTENGDLVFVDGVIGQDVDGQIEAQAR